MKYYLINPVLEEIEKSVIALLESKKLSDKQAVLVLNIIRKSMEQYNLENLKRSICRCGKCLKVLENNLPTYSLEEMNRITGGMWWSEELESETAFDTLCQECYDSLLQKYFRLSANQEE